MRCRPPLSIFIIRCVSFHSLLSFYSSFYDCSPCFCPSRQYIYIYDLFSLEKNDDVDDDDDPPRNSTSRHLRERESRQGLEFSSIRYFDLLFSLFTLLSLIFPPHFLVFLPVSKTIYEFLPLGVWQCICFTNGHRHFLTQGTLEVEIFLSKLLLQIVTLEVPSLGIIILLLIHECDDSRDRIVIYIPSVCS